MVKPFTKTEAVANKSHLFPDFVIEAVNMLLYSHYSTNGCARLMQSEVINTIINLSGNTVTKNQIFENHWLDFEDIYRNQGWKVFYDKPGYNESYEPYWEFR